MTVARVSSVILLLALAASCYPISNPTLPPKPTRLTLWHPYGAELGEQFDTLVKDFNASHPDIVVESSYGGSLWTLRDKLSVSLAGNAGPDMSVIDQFWSSELADGAALVPIEEFLANDPAFDRTDLWPVAWETATYDGKIWSMPFSVSHLVLFYNRALFTQAGLNPDKPPSTWDELERAALAMTVDGDRDGVVDKWGLSLPLRADQGVVYTWFAFLWQAGGQIFDSANTSPRFQDAPGIDALSFWQRLVRAGALPLSPPDTAFEAGQVGMTIASTARLPRYIKALGSDLGAAVLPCGNACATGVGGANLAILARCKNPGAAWEFVRWMSSPSVNLRWSTQTGYLPLRRSVVESKAYKSYLESEPRAGVIVEQVPIARARPNVPAYAAVSREVGIALESALFSNNEPAAALADAARHSAPLLSESGLVK